MTTSVRIAPYLRALRKATEIAIKIDPREIILIPYAKTKMPSGGYDYVAGTPRAAQTFVIEPNESTISGIAASSGGIAGGDGGSAHQWSYYLVGRYDSEMEIGDRWTDGDTLYRIISIQPKNDYEKRAVVTAFGPDPNYGN